MTIILSLRYLLHMKNHLNGYLIKKNVTLEDLNSLYFGPVGRTLSENEIFKLEHFVIAESLK